jgi:hypothetical protein
MLSTKIKNKTRMSAVTPHSSRSARKTKGIQIAKEEIKFSLAFANDMFDST